MILASRSPQRKRILESLGIEFQVVPSLFDESSVGESDPSKRAMVLAEKKAETVSADYPDEWVIGVDTLVVSEDGQLLEKPIDEADVRRMLQLHSGRTSTVHSAICFMLPLQKHVDVSTAHVTFKTLTDADIDWWIQTELWQDRSGSFQIEGEGQKLVHALDGEIETVIGFPIQVFTAMREKCDINLP